MVMILLLQAVVIVPMMKVLLVVVVMLQAELQHLLLQIQVLVQAMVTEMEIKETQ